MELGLCKMSITGPVKHQSVAIDGRRPFLRPLDLAFVRQDGWFAKKVSLIECVAKGLMLNVLH